MPPEPSPNSEDSPRLVCEDCGKEADHDAKGWIGLHGREDNNDVTVVVPCPECWAKQFTSE